MELKEPPRKHRPVVRPSRYITSATEKTGGPMLAVEELSRRYSGVWR
jgi:hypothetical protein